MKLNLTLPNLQQIYKVCSPHVSKKDTQPALQYIHLDFDGDKVTATACKSSQFAQTVVPGEGDVGHYLIPITKVPKGMFCIIENDDKNMTIDFLSSKIVERMPNNTRIFDVEETMPKLKPTLTIGFNADLMAETMKSFKGCTALKFEFINKTSGVVISDGVSRVMLLPVRLKEVK